MPFTRDELKAGTPNPDGRIRNRNRGIPTQQQEPMSLTGMNVIRTTIKNHSTTADTFVKHRSDGLNIKGSHKA